MVRRRLIIEPRFQRGFTLAFLRGVLLAIAIPGLVAFFAVQVIGNNPNLSDAERIVLSTATKHALLLYLAGAGVLGALSAVVGLLLSHRYAGPLKRIESWSARHLLGEPIEDLVLRPGDELTGVAATLAQILGGKN